jgi:hypothetical protein
MAKLRFLKYCLFLLLSIISLELIAQDNYEIQVYASPTMKKGTTMFELHSNYNFGGSKDIKNGVNPTHGVFHETIEITHGFTNNFEIGFYLFNSIGPNGSTGYVGSHIRPRISAPEKWHLPFGLSLSGELGYQKLKYSEDDWTLEIRPIIDKTFGKFYISLNPTIDRAIKGLNKDEGYVFSPNVKASYAINQLIAGGVEYYGSMGPFNRFLPLQEQDAQLFITADLSFSPDWEFNMGYGFGLNNSTDASIFKVILGRRIDWHAKK